MSERRDKSNKKFMLLSAIGIFMVVDHHTFTAFNVLGDFLPYNSFFMPMFVFISGYFNKVDGSTNLWAYLYKKVKTLLLPYAGLSLTVFGLQQLVNYIKLGGKTDALPDGYLTYVLKRVVTTGSYGAIAEPMWFVIALFATLTVYAVLKKLLCKAKLWNSYVMLVLFCGLHLFVIYLAKNTAFESLENWLVPLKCLFFLPFLELGIIYKEHLEKKHTAMSGTSKIAVMFFLLILNAVRTSYMPMPYDIAFDSIDVLGGFTSPYIVTPMVSSLIGILFWLTLTELVGKQVSESRFVNFMSCNTFWIMGLHITFYNILNCVLMAIDKSIVRLPHFDAEAFQETEWYFWELGGNIKILYVVVGVLGPLGLKWLYDRLCTAADRKIKSIGAESEQKVKTLTVLSKFVFAAVFVAVIGLIVILTKPKAIVDEPYGEEPGTEAGVNGQTDTTPTGISGENDPDPQVTVEPLPADLSPVYAYLDLAYEHGGESADYLVGPGPVNGNGTFSVSVKRGDDNEAPLAIDGLSYMGIRILDDDHSDLDITGASVTDVAVVCDGVSLRVDISGTVPYEDGVILIFFDCYDPKVYPEGTDLTGAASYDFGGKSEIQVSFTVAGAKAK
ncbi:MAG: acyltransferase [Lachnospiraceae bacterium]|nr:acyltransferase [Lachnospiraceae bacterium]